MTNEGALGGFDPTEHAAEAQARWGKTDDYHESARRTAGYTPQDWADMRRESDDIIRAFLELKAVGRQPGDRAVGAVVDRHRDHISKWFYECTPAIHAGLGQMYVTDARFSENIDHAGDGLAQYMADAIESRYSGVTPA